MTQRSKNYNGTLADAVNVMIDDSGKTIKAIVADVGKNYNTFMRELNPNDEGAKIGVEMLYPLIVACCGQNPKEAPAPLLWLCHRLGFEPLPFGFSEPGASTVEAECMESVQSVAAAHKAIMEKKSPAEVFAAVAFAKNDLDQDATIYNRIYQKQHMRMP